MIRDQIVRSQVKTKRKIRFEILRPQMVSLVEMKMKWLDMNVLVGTK